MSHVTQRVSDDMERAWSVLEDAVLAADEGLLREFVAEYIFVFPTEYLHKFVTQ